MPVFAFTSLCVLVLAIAFSYVPSYVVMSPIEFVLTFGVFTIPLIAIAHFWKDKEYENVFIVCFLSMAIYVHPVIPSLGAIEHSIAYSSQPGSEDYDPGEPISFERREASKRILLDASFDRRLEYSARTEKAKILSQMMRSDSLEFFRRYQPNLFWFFPPSLAFLFLGLVLYFFGCHLPKERN
jgi:hypothetical protein